MPSLGIRRNQWIIKEGFEIKKPLRRKMNAWNMLDLPDRAQIKHLLIW
jgi:hypothetical protein